MSLSARRAKPRKIASTADDDESGDVGTPVIKRPLPKTKKLSAPARLSFCGGGDMEETGFVPKKSALSRKAMERNAAKKAAAVVGMEQLAIAPERERVSYSKEYLAELRSMQLVASDAAEDVAMVDLEGASVEGLDVDAAGGGAAQVVVHDEGWGTRIMDEGLVRVMKARRAERVAAARAGVDDFISLHDDDDDDDDNDDRNGLMLRPKKKKESRLARPDDFADDEEIANYVDDAERVLLTTSKAARREQERRRKQAIAETIAVAEGADDEGSDVSRDSLVEEFERDQIRKGAFTTEQGRGLEAELEALARNPPASQELPDIRAVVARLEGALKELEVRKRVTERQVEMLMQEKREIKEREDMVQTRLKEAGAKYEHLKREMGGSLPAVDRGLESFGDTPIRVEE